MGYGGYLRVEFMLRAHVRPVRVHRADGEVEVQREKSHAPFNHTLHTLLYTTQVHHRATYQTRVVWLVS